MRAIIASLILNVLLVSIVGGLAIYELNVSIEKQNRTPSIASMNLEAKNITFTDRELKTWLGIKDRLAVINTDPDFPDLNESNRVLGWYSMRNSSSGDYYQKSMEYLCFWKGQGVNGEWEAVVSIYNEPNDSSHFVVEISRFTWYSLKVTLDNITVREFPQITEDATSLGYATFVVTPL
jgi:hypothetical protein